VYAAFVVAADQVAVDALRGKKLLQYKFIQQA
jgi:hypothetical protein